jgi:N-acetyl sugar amidotransferase
MPETTEGITFDENGICRACTSSEQKMHINWEERRNDLNKILDQAKSEARLNKTTYDCIVPISGGKDSVFQLHVLTKVYDLKVLAVTFSHNWYSKIGFYNLMNCLEEFNIDHIQMTPARSTVNMSARKSLKSIGDACWHCHSGVGAFPLQIAVNFKIPLLIWGESIAEMSGRASHFEPVLKFDRDYFIKVSAKVKVDDFVDNKEDRRTFSIFEPPSIKECEKAGVKGIHLGDFIFWDEERQTEFIKQEYNWIEDEVEGAYKGYKSVECIMPGVHDFTNYLKRGYGRSTVQASMDIRQGLMIRKDAKKIAENIDSIEPEVLNYYLDITGYSKDEFYRIMKEKRFEQLDKAIIQVKNSNNLKKNVKPFVIDFIDDVRNENAKRDTRENK